MSIYWHESNYLFQKVGLLRISRKFINICLSHDMAQILKAQMKTGLNLHPCGWRHLTVEYQALWRHPRKARTPVVVEGKRGSTQREALATRSIEKNLELIFPIVFRAILQHYKNWLGTTLNMVWNAIDVSFQIIPYKFTLKFEKVTLHSKLSQHLKWGNFSWYLELFG